MDIAQLSGLGKVAGVPGIALGVAALVLGAVVEAAGVLPEAWRGPVFVVLVLGAVFLGGLALFGWVRSTRAGPQIARTEGDGSPALNVDRTRTGGIQTASTRGGRSPAINVRE